MLDHGRARRAEPAFGLLALQNGLIDQVQLVAAFQAWTRDKLRPLADYLIDRGDIDAADRAAVEVLASRNLKKHGGSTVKSLASIPARASTCKSLAQLSSGDRDIEATLAHVGTLEIEKNGEDITSAADDRTTDYSVGTVTSGGERFRILRPHARGGLGAVFVAARYRSSTAKSPSSRFSTRTRTTR